MRSPNWTPRQADEYRDWLQPHFPDNDVLVLLADEVFVERPAPAPYWTTTRGGHTVMSDDDLRRFAEKIGRQVRGDMRHPLDDDPDDGLAGVPARR